MEERRNLKTKPRHHLTKEQKAGLVLLLLIGIVGAFFGLKSFPARLSRPFEIQFASYTGERFMTLSEREAAETERQKSIDSDSDGLNDYDELNVYKTSPYLADSDSDGFDDKTEIFTSHDPNCPEGKDCASGSSLTSSSEGVVEGDAGQTANLLLQAMNLSDSDYQGTSFETIDDIMDFFAQLKPDDIRSLLIAQGLPKETVDSFSDEEVRELLAASLEEAEASGAFEEVLSSE